MIETYNGYKNHETWAMALWLDNNEFIVDDILPSIFHQNKNNIYLAGEFLKNLIENEDSLVREVLEQDWNAIRQDVGSFWRVEWSELFGGLE